MIAPQALQQLAAMPVGQVGVDQPQIVDVPLGAGQCTGDGIGGIHVGGQGFQCRLQETAGDDVVLDQQETRARHARRIRLHKAASMSATLHIKPRGRPCKHGEATSALI
jgi:hypothetical protein